MTDGSPWCQRVIDEQRSDAIRILDWAHAVEQLAQLAQMRFGTGTAATSAWLGQQVHALRHGHAAAVITELARQLTDPAGSAEAGAVARRCHGYLDTRREQIRYQHFVEHGYPIGSGCVESANTLVVEARLKGSGMHWARVNVDPMLALRTVWCNERWEAAWPTIWARLRTQPQERTSVRRQGRRARQQAAVPESVPMPPVDSPPPSPLAPPADPVPVTPPRQKTIVNGKPTPEHYWRRSSPFGAKR